MTHLHEIKDREIHDKRYTLAYFAGLVAVAVFVVLAIGAAYNWW
jgi:hypothetical protein